MADTRQCVYWSLERACCLRTGEGWQLPLPTQQTLSTLQLCSIELNAAKPKVVDGIWVTGTYVGRDSADKTVHIPASGINVDEIGERYGGWQAIRNTCATCQANVVASRDSRHSNNPELEIPKRPSIVGGCFGSIEVMYPNSKRLDELLWRVIDRYALEDQLRDAFQLTDPLWFGFWMDSPLDRKQRSCLLQLLERALPQLWEKPADDPAAEPVFGDVSFAFSGFNPAKTYGQEYADFFRALEVSLRYDLPLHVHVPPPGHADFGFTTIFAHCPRCKAAADVPRWQAVESCDYECTVCGHRFDPAVTHSSTAHNFDYDTDSLEAQLGQRYDAFTMKYARLRGYSQAQMRDVLDIHRDGPNKRRVASTRARVESSQRKWASEVSQIELRKLPQELFIELAPDVVLEFVLVPAGEFLMGEFPSDERLQLHKRRIDEESVEPENSEDAVETSNDSLAWCQTMPIHPVRFDRPFYIGKFPVTQVQWRAVMGNNPSWYRFPNHPVEQVDWFTAQEFCTQLSDRLQRVLRLPSEAEWEYACRAGTTTPCYCGDRADREHANLDHDRSEADFFSLGDHTKVTTTPVDKYPPNPWGIYDMLGNVNEWCQDAWHANYENAPTDGSAWVDSPEPVEHVARGVAAYVIASACRSGARLSQRANCGANPQNDAVEDQAAKENERRKHLSSLVELFGLRLVCEPIADDAAYTDE